MKQGSQSCLLHALSERSSAAFGPELAACGPVFALDVGDQDVHRFGRATEDFNRDARDLFDQLALLFDGAAFHHFDVVCGHVNLLRDQVLGGWVGDIISADAGGRGLSVPSAQAGHRQALLSSGSGMRASASGATGVSMHQQLSGSTPARMAH